MNTERPGKGKKTLIVGVDPAKPGTDQSVVVLDPGCTGLPHLCPKCGASVPPEQVSQVCTKCSHSLVYPYSTKRDEKLPLHSMSLGPEPMTVAEWIEQCNRTGILEFPLLLAIGKRLEEAVYLGVGAGLSVRRPCPSCKEWCKRWSEATDAATQAQRERDDAVLDSEELRAVNAHHVEERNQMRANWEGKSKECEGAWAEVRYWTAEAAKARREADIFRAKLRMAPNDHSESCGCDDCKLRGLELWSDAREAEDRKARPCTHGLLDCQPCLWRNGFSVLELQAKAKS